MSYQKCSIIYLILLHICSLIAFYIYALSSRLLVSDKRERMSAEDALEHPWLRPLYTGVDDWLITQRSRIIPTQLHRKFYQSVREKVRLNCIIRGRYFVTDHFRFSQISSTIIVSLGRYASGGALRSSRGKSIAKVKVESVTLTPSLCPMYHVFAKEGDDAKLVCKIKEPSHNETVTW